MHVRIPALIAIATSLTLVGAAPTALEAGVQALCDALKVTFGPKGRNVVVKTHFGAPTITVDGVSIAKEIELNDPVSFAGAELVKEVAKLTNDQVDAVNKCLKA